MRKFKSPKKGIRIRIKHGTRDLGYEMKEVFIGHRTFFSLLGFIVGGILVGRSAYEYLSINYGLIVTIIVGIIIFILSGIILHEFHEVADLEVKDDELMF